MKKYSLMILVLLAFASAYTCDMAAAVATDGDTLDWDYVLPHYCQLLNSELNSCPHPDGRGITLHISSFHDGIFSQRNHTGDLSYNSFSGYVPSSKVMLNHARDGSSGSSLTAFHPFVWDSRTNSKIYTFMHNGTVSVNSLQALLAEGADDDWLNDAFDHLHDNNDNVAVTSIEYICDSEYYFYWLIKNIEANRDILKGLEQALFKLDISANDHVWRNFMFSDGNDLYLYKRGTKDHGNNDDYEHRIFYGEVIVHPDQNPNVSEYPGAYIAVTQNVSLDYDGASNNYFEPIPSANELSDGDLVVIESDGTVTLYENFGVHNGNLNYIPKINYIAGDSINWKCFPVDYPSLMADDQLEETEDFFDELSYWNNGLQTVLWEHMDDTDLEYTQGYKLELTGLGRLSILQYDLKGTHVLEDREIPLDHLQNRFWIPCFVHGSATVYDAFEGIIDYATQIKAQYWTMWRKYTTDSWTIAIDPGKTPTCYYGNMYDVILTSAHPTVMDYYGLLGYEESEEEIPEKTEYYGYIEKLDYEAILIDTIVSSEPIEEVAVFEGDECIGASVFSGYPVFLRAFTTELNRDNEPLKFRIYTGYRSEPEVEYRIYDEDFALYREKRLYPHQNVITRICLAAEGETMPVMNDITVHDKQYPDPFNPETAIEYSIPETGNVSITIYNIKGQRVKNLLSCEQTAGLHKVIWNGTDQRDRRTASGLYFYELKYKGQCVREKMMLIK